MHSIKRAMLPHTLYAVHVGIRFKSNGTCTFADLVRYEGHSEITDPPPFSNENERFIH